MHYIEKRLDCKFEVGVYGQSGYERSTHDTLDEAIDSYRYGVAWLGGPQCKPETVKIPHIIDRSEWPLIRVEKDGKFKVSQDQFEHAIRLAIHKKPLEGGILYQLVVSFDSMVMLPLKSYQEEAPPKRKNRLLGWMSYFLSRSEKPKSNMDLDEIDLRGS